jgi:integrase
MAVQDWFVKPFNDKGGLMQPVLFDAAGHRRSPATMPGYHCGRPPRNKGEHYPADPPTVEEIVAVMRAVGDRADGQRLRALVVLLWRAGLRVGEALDLQESDLDDPTRGAILVRRGKGGKRCEVGMDRWAWGQLDPWLQIRREFRSERCCASSKWSSKDSSGTPTSGSPDQTVRRLKPTGRSARARPPAPSTGEYGARPSLAATPASLGHLGDRLRSPPIRQKLARCSGTVEDLPGHEHAVAGD